MHPRAWNSTLVPAGFGLALAAAGFALTLARSASPVIIVALLLAALACVALAFGHMAWHMRHLELAREGLFEEWRGEFDRANDRAHVLGEELAEDEPNRAAVHG